MVKIRLSIFLFVLMGLNGLFAQSQFGAEEVVKNFPDANFVVLREDHKLTFYYKKDELKLKHECFYQYMYLDNTGVISNERSVIYQPGKFVVTSLEACSYQPEGKGYKKMKVEKITDEGKLGDDVFYDDTRYKSFTFPGIKKNGVIEYSYTYDVLDLTSSLSFWFKDNMPVIDMNVSVTFPDGVDVGYGFFGDSANIHFKRTDVKGKHTYQWTTHNLEQLHEYNDDLGFKYICPHVNLFVKGYNLNGKYVNHLGNEKDLYKFFYKYTTNLNKADPDKKLLTVVDSIKKTAKDKEDLTQKIYYWVKDNVKYIAFEDGDGGRQPREANDVFRKKYGDCKDYSSLISHMLNNAGVNAYLCWIGTSSIPYSFYDLPTPATCNHMIAAVKPKDKWIFLDGTSRSSSYGIPSGFIQGKEAMIGISPDSFNIAKVPIMDAEKNIRKRMFKIKVGEKNVLSIAAKSSLSGYPKFAFTDFLLSLDARSKDENTKSALFEGSNKAKVENYSFSNLESKDSALTSVYNVTLPDYVNEIDNDFYINLNLTRTLAEDFKVDTAHKRVVSKAFRHTFNDETTYELEIPKGYSVKYIPENYSYSDDLFTISIDYKVVNSVITLKQKVKYNSLFVKSDYFETWNKQVASLDNAYREVIVLTKKTK